MIALARLPELGASTRRIAAEQRRHLSLWNHRNLIFGCGAIATCVWAEISVGSLFINFASQPSVADITREQAAFYITVFWRGMQVDGVAGPLSVPRFPPEQAVAAYAAGGV